MSETQDYARSETGLIDSISDFLQLVQGSPDVDFKRFQLKLKKVTMFGMEYPEFIHVVSKHFAYLSLASMCVDKSEIAGHGFGGDTFCGGQIDPEDRWKLLVVEMEKYAEGFGSDIEVGGAYNVFLQAFGCGVKARKEKVVKETLKKCNTLIDMHKARAKLQNRA